MTLIVPGECRETKSVSDYLDKLIADKTNPINEVKVFDLKQSMNNGGGPACLRLRIAINEQELAEMHQGVLLTDNLYENLNRWVEKHYRDRLVQADLSDPQLLMESRTALDELTQITGVGSIYPFQR
jgi:succinylarginine dihydrolase